MPFCNDKKYKLLNEIDSNKVYLLQERNSQKKVVAKKSPNNQGEYKCLQLLADIEQTSSLVDYADEILYIDYIENSQTLEQVISLQQAIDIEDFYNLAFKVIDILSTIHTAGIIHKDLSTSNILCVKNGEKFYIIDFGASSSIKETVDVNQNLNELKADFNFVSPEQTGRINRSVDFRSDFYSLGAVFYNLLAGKPPFIADDLIGVIHKHLSQKPTRLDEINTNIPSTLSNIVLKLLCKEPEDRYQTLTGLKHDLARSQTEKIDFKLGLLDKDHQIFIKHAHYGREQLITELKYIFKKTVSGRNKLITIAGYSGTGKTSVIHELHKTLNINFGFFAESKFDQFSASTPYYGFMKVLNDYFENLLKDTTYATQIAEKILNALGDEAFMLSSKIEHLEKLIGKQAVKIGGAPREEEIKFNQHFISLLKIITSNQRPIIFFIDDLQWADLGTIDLIELVNCCDEIENLLIINAYRNNEVDASHSYFKMLTTLKNTNDYHEFSIDNLSRKSVHELIADVVHNNDESLADIVFDISNGNAFIINQLIDLFIHEQLIKFDNSSKEFIYNIELIKKIGLNENIADIATRNIKVLDSHAIELLKTASAVGNRFTSPLLSLLTNIDVKELEDMLEQALEKNFLYLISGQYKFAHDRIQQAFYMLNHEQAVAELHKNIAVSLDKNRLDINIFSNIDLEIVGHLNKAHKTLNANLCNTAIKLNYKVAKEVKTSFAYQESIRYINAGLTFLDKNDKELRWDFLFLKLEVYFISSKLEELGDLIIALEPLADTDEKSVSLAKYVVNRGFMMGTHFEAIDYGVTTLIKMGVNIPRRANKLTVLKEFVKFKYYLRGKEYKDILNFPENKNKKMLLVTGLIYDLLNPSYLVSNDLYNSYALIASTIAVKYGNSKYSAYCYSTLSLLFGGVYKQFDIAEEIGSVAVKLGEKFYELDSTSRANFIYGDFVLHGTKPFDDYINFKNYSDKGFIKGGNVLYRNYNEFFTVAQQTLCSPSTLNNIYQQCLDVHTLYTKSNEKALINFQTYILSFLSRMRCGNIQPVIEQYGFDENEYSRNMEVEINLVLSSTYFTYRAIELYLFGKFEQAFECINKAAPRIIAQQGLLTDPIFRFFYCLCFLEQPVYTYKQKIEYLINRQLLKRHASFSAQNFSVYYYLILAQEAVKKKNSPRAIHYFDKALAETLLHGNAFHKALTNELYGLFLLAENKNSAQEKLSAAHQFYVEFQALAKADDIKKEHLLDESRHSQPILPSNSGGTNLDFEVIMKAAQTISEEVKVDDILQRMSLIILQNLGASRGFILLQKGAKLVICSSIDDSQCQVYPDMAIEDEALISSEIINSVSSSKAVFMSENASKDPKLTNDQYVQLHQPKSILAVPMVRNNILKGVLYCENNLISAAFTQKTVDITFIILSQLVISLDNAFAYENLESIVTERTQDLTEQKKTADAVSFRLQLAAKASKIGIWEWNYASDRIIWDERSCQIYGLTKNSDPFPLNVWSELVDKHDRKRVQENLNHAIESNTEYNVNYWITTSAGEKRYIHAIGISQCDHTGNPVRMVGTYIDLTEEKLLQLNLEKERSRFALAIEGANDGLWDWDLISDQVTLSERFESMLGYNFGDLPRTLVAWFGLLHPEDKDKTEKAVNSYLEKETRYGFEARFRLRRKDGSWCWILGRGKAQFAADGKCVRFVGFNTDITEQIEYQNRLDHSAKHDSLTHLPNRFLLSELLTQSMHSAKRRGRVLAILFIDLDGFKSINDTYGHDAGDEVLVTAANRMCNGTRSSDIVSRIGGDEFVILLSDLNNALEVLPLAKQLLRNLADDMEVNDTVMNISASIGISFYPQQENIGNEVLLRQADQAMYNAKLAGKNQYQFYKLEENQKIKEHQKMLSVLVQALEEQQFVLYYQPKVSMSKGKITGFEALLRWNHSEKGIIYPNSFLNIVNEDPNYMNQLGKWVFKTAVAQLEKWTLSGFNFSLSINVSAHELQHEDFLPYLTKILNEHPNIDPAMIELEVLETAALENFQHTSEILKACQQLGLSIAIDDFGTGYASLHYLKELSFNTLKIDKSFVIGLLDSSKNISIIESVIGLAHAFNATVIAEGVESIEQGNILLQLGCDLAQGYAISKAMSVDEVEHWLASWQGDNQWETMQVIDKYDREILFASVGHTVWLNNIRLFIEKKSSELPPLENNQCTLYRWLHSTATEEQTNHSNFKKIDHLYTEIHQYVDKVLQNLDEDKSTEIETLYAMNTKLLSLLNTLRAG